MFITRENANLGASLALILDPKDLSIQAKPGTPLSVIVNAAKIPSGVINTVTPNEITPGFYTQELSNQDNNDVLNLQADEMILAISKATKTHISFAKNVVAPVVTDMVERVHKEVDSLNNSAISFEVITRDIPLPMRNDALVSTIEREANGNSLMPEADVKIPPMELTDVKNLLSSGSSVFDNDVLSWLNKIGDEFILSVWGSVFSSDSGNTPVTSLSFTQLINDRKTGLDAALLIYLFSQSLESNIPEGVAMPLNRYKELLNQYRSAVIETMKRGLDEDKSRNLAEQIVISVNQNLKQVEVYEPTYNRWLENGGVQETLAGMVISGQSLYNGSAINERKEEFLKNWDQYVNMQKNLFEVNSFNTFKVALENAFKESFANPFEAEIEWFSNSVEVDKIFDYFNQELNNVVPDDMNDINATVMRLLGKSRFYYTDSIKFLQAMTKASKKNPNIDPREAALLATIEYVSDFFADQMQVV